MYLLIIHQFRASGYLGFPALVPALNLFLPALALNLCVSVLCFTVKICYG